MQPNRSIIVPLAATLLLMGAGCAPSANVAIPAQDANGDTALSMRAQQIQLDGAVPRPAPTPAPAPDSTQDSSMTDTAMPDASRQFPGVLPDAELKDKQVRIATPYGDIVFEVLADEAPKAASNMIALAKSGYYDGLTFHRVVPGFVIQGGDPTGTGAGGPGYKFEDETVRLDYDAGIVAMANAGPNTNGSQFFIVLEDQPSLPKLYTIFGRVVSGMDAVRKVRVGDVMSKVTVEERQ